MTNHPGLVLFMGNREYLDLIDEESIQSKVGKKWSEQH